MPKISGNCSSIRGTVVWDGDSVHMPSASNLAILVPADSDELVNMMGAVSDMEREFDRALTVNEVVSIARGVVGND